MSLRGAGLAPGSYRCHVLTLEVAPLLLRIEGSFLNLKAERSCYFSVSFNSMRRFFAKLSGVFAVSSGWFSPKPAATRRFAGTPSLIKKRTTEVALDEESSQFEGKRGVLIGWRSV